MRIRVMGKSSFDSLMKHLGVFNGNVELKQQHFFISINGTETIADDKPYFDNKENVKVIHFDDVEEDLHWEANGVKKKATAFSLEQAKELLEFIDKHKDKEMCIVHCAAGISRSGAVGTFISDYVGNDYFDFKRANPHIHPNGLVLRLLKQALREKCE